VPASLQVYLCAAACDIGKSFDGLQMLETQTMELAP
jgi:hypothetical protein